jgi:hypothetical protein
MFAIKQARKFIENHPEAPETQILIRLVLCLQQDQPFELSRLYELDAKCFEVALDIIKEWRLDRHYAKKEKLLGVIQQRTEEA